MAGAELTSYNRYNLEAQREGLAFVAGFVAYKCLCHHIDATLGSRSPDFSGAAAETLNTLPDSCIVTISRGQLFVLSQAWMAAVEEVERNFCLLMGASADQGPRVI